MNREKEGFPVDRVYYGAEFCQALLPDVEELEDAYRAWSNFGFGFTFVTPAVNDMGLERLVPMLAYLSARNEKNEVVVNDWGVLALINSDFPMLEPVLGRLMNKMLRDPRVAPRYNTPDAPAEPLQALQQSGVTNPQYRRILELYRVERIELDNLYQGIEMDFQRMGLKPSIYVPYGYVTTGRVCLFGSLHKPRDGKFIPHAACRKECKRYIASMVDVSHGIGRGSLFQIGNTVFYRQNDEMVEKAFSWAEPRKARIVCRADVREELSFATETISLAGQWVRKGPAGALPQEWRGARV